MSDRGANPCLSAAVRPIVSVVVPLAGRTADLKEAVRSVFAQTLRPLELVLVDIAADDETVLVARELLGEVPEGIAAVFHAGSGSHPAAALNEGLIKARSRFLSVLDATGRYDPRRLEACVSALEAADGQLAMSYVDAVGADGASLSVEHPWRQSYADAVLYEIDVAQSLSTLILSRDLVVARSNLVFRADLPRKIGGFRDLAYLQGLDFALRSSLAREPILIREPLLRHRLVESNQDEPALAREYETVVHDHLDRLLADGSTNPFAPSFDRPHGFAAGAIMAPHLSGAMDRLIERPCAIDGANEHADDFTSLPIDVPHGATDKKRRPVTLVTHQLKFTGAPVLLRGIADGLNQYGLSGRLLSLEDGPLRRDFEELGFPMVREWRLTRTLVVLSGYAAYAARLRGLPPRLRKIAQSGADLLSAATETIRTNRIRYLTRLDRRGVLLVNSFASWPLALALADRWKGPAFWYIHETFEPVTLLRSRKLLDRLRRLVDRGKITMLYGSNATRSVWARYGYDGPVRYWSGASMQARLVEAADTGRRVVLSVQTVGRRKGTWALIEAFAYGRRTGLIPKDVELRIIGCTLPSIDPMARDLLARVHRPDLRGSVRLLSELTPAALASHYEEANVYVQTSIMECLPLALLKAMEHSLSIVSTDADGCREAIENEVTGLLVPQQASEPIATAIGRLLAEPDLAARLAASARQRFEDEFCIEVTLPKLIATLEDGQRLSGAGSPVGT